MATSQRTSLAGLPLCANLPTTAKLSSSRWNDFTLGPWTHLQIKMFEFVHVFCWLGYDYPFKHVFLSMIWIHQGKRVTWTLSTGMTLVMTTNLFLALGIPIFIWWIVLKYQIVWLLVALKMMLDAQGYCKCLRKWCVVLATRRKTFGDATGWTGWRGRLCRGFPVSCEHCLGTNLSRNPFSKD